MGLYGVSMGSYDILIQALASQKEVNGNSGLCWGGIGGLWGPMGS